LPEIRRFEDLMWKVRTHNGASDTYAANLRACLLEAGFERTEAQAGTKTPAGSAQGPPIIRMILENQVRERAFRDTVIEQGWATEVELDALAEAAARLGDRKDLFGFIVYVQALGWVAS
jgi:hypothetical protein